jgi:multisubunit Na+/H+ antiporter MnhB subunit
MIFLYLALLVALGIFEIVGLNKKQGKTKDFVVLIVLFLLVSVFGGIYLSDNFRPSLSSYALDFFKVER